MRLQHFAEQTGDDPELAKVQKAIVLLQGILADHSAGAGGGVGDNPGDEARSSFDAGLLTLTPGGAVTAPPLDERRQLSAAQRSTLVPPICVNWPSGVVQTLVRVICSRCGTDNPNRATFCNECAAPLPAITPPAGRCGGRCSSRA
jgi:hypothetical protein